MKLINEISRRARTVGRFGMSMAVSALPILHRVIVSLALVLIVFAPNVSASELSDNQKVLDKYQKIFRMDNFHIELVMTTQHFIAKMSGNPNAVAASQFNPNTQYGVIYVMTRDQYIPALFEALDMKVQGNRWRAKDQRNSVVHELIHCIWNYAPSDEFAVSILANAVNP